ncbi:argininosuccinate synthetase [Podochytrium sp. JEL0797]|nr:argininosuccinate synthetase [Podochytrium sp. JEL0797]
MTKLQSLHPVLQSALRSATDAGRHAAAAAAPGQARGVDVARLARLCGLSAADGSAARRDIEQLLGWVAPIAAANLRLEKDVAPLVSFARDAAVPVAFGEAKTEDAECKGRALLKCSRSVDQATGLYIYPLPTIKVIAPWRIPAFFHDRNALLAYATEKDIPVFQTVAKPWSTDETLHHISEEDPNVTPPKDMWKLITDPEDSPNIPERIAITFEGGKPVKAQNKDDGKVITDGLEQFLYLSHLGRKHGIGRIDIVENRFIGIKRLELDASVSNCGT